MLLLLRALLAADSTAGGREQPARGAASLQAMLSSCKDGSEVFKIDAASLFGARLPQPLRPKHSGVWEGCGGLAGLATVVEITASALEAPKSLWLVGRLSKHGCSGWAALVTLVALWPVSRFAGSLMDTSNSIAIFAAAPRASTRCCKVLLWLQLP